MTTNEMARKETSVELLEKVIMDGDLSKLSPGERMAYYNKVCESLGLNPLTRPFDYIKLSGKLTLYAKRDAADQLRKLHGISCDKPDILFQNDLVIITITGRDKTGRSDSDVGAVPTLNLKGEALGNAIKKAITQAKRRLTLSIVGLGWLDETEVDTIPAVVHVPVDSTTGEIASPTQPLPRGSRDVIQAPSSVPGDDYTTGPSYDADGNEIPKGNTPKESDFYEAVRNYGWKGSKVSEWLGISEDEWKSKSLGSWLAANPGKNAYDAIDACLMADAAEREAQTEQLL